MRWPVGHTIIHEDHESPVTPRATTLDLNDEPEIGEASAELSLQCHVSNTLMTKKHFIHMFGNIQF